jgi:hypothetical protein
MPAPPGSSDRGCNCAQGYHHRTRLLQPHQALTPAPRPPRPPPAPPQIKLKEAARYLAASEASAKQLASQAADRAYQRQFASRSLAPVHPMLRNVAEPEPLDAGGAGPSGAAGAPVRIGMGPVQRQAEDPELRRLRLQVGGGLLLLSKPLNVQGFGRARRGAAVAYVQGFGWGAPKKLA